MGGLSLKRSLLKPALFALPLILSVFCTACSPSSPSGAASSASEAASTQLPSAETDPAPESAPAVSLETEVEVEGDGVIVDTKDYSVKLLKAGVIDYRYRLQIVLENKTADKDIKFEPLYAAVNGVHQSTIGTSTTLAPGETKEELRDLFDLEKYGLPYTEYTNILLKMRISDASPYTYSTYGNYTLWTGMVHIYPLGKEKAANYVYQLQEGERVLMDNDTATVICTGYEPHEFMDQYQIHLVLINKTDRLITFTSDDLTFNGHKARFGYRRPIPAGLTAFDDMEWISPFPPEQKFASTEAMESLHFTLKVQEGELSNGEVLAQEEVTITP